MVTEKIEKELKKLATKKRAINSASFFKTGRGEYGEGDIFLGVKVPEIRKVVKNYLKEISLKDTILLLQSKYHEVRFSGVVSMVEMMKQAIKSEDEKLQKQIFDTYLKNTNRINNWDLVDVSCPNIIGVYLLGKDRNVLYKLVKSKNIWERRITIISTFAFLKKGDYKDTLALAEILLKDKHDLIHKAVGWALREVGKNCGIETLNIFLEKHIQSMPRITLRYALEKHHPFQKLKYLKI